VRAGGGGGGGGGAPVLRQQAKFSTLKEGGYQESRFLQ